MCSKSTAHCTLFLAMILTIGAFVLMAISFATYEWVKVTVKREKLPANSATDFWTYNRQYGLFQSCVTDEGFKPDPKISPVDFFKVNNYYCFNLDYKFGTNATEGLTRKDEQHTHFMRVTAGFFILCFFWQVLIIIVSCTGFCLRKSILIHAAAILSLVSGVFLVMAMGFFHGYTNLENESLVSEPFYPSLWSSVLNENSTVTFGYSYALGWAAAILCIINAVIFGFSAYYLANRGRWDLFSTDSTSSLAKYHAGADFYNYPHPQTGHYNNQGYYQDPPGPGYTIRSGSIPRAKVSTMEYDPDPMMRDYRTVPRQHYQTPEMDYNSMAFYTPRSLRGPPVHDVYADFYDPQRTFERY